MQNTKRRIQYIVPAFFVFCVFVLSGCGVPMEEEVVNVQEVQTIEKVKDVVVEEEAYPHVALPEEVRGIYWTAVTARSDYGQYMLEYMLETGLNTVVVDVKMDNGALQDLETYREILDQLHEEGVYRIARVAVMRDAAFAYQNPDVALYAAGGGYWYDSIGSVWVDPASEKVVDYAIELGEQLYEVGFDEIQYDYVRFASDGAVSSIVYPVYDHTETKAEVMQQFFARVGGAMRDQGIPVSFDVFGMTFESHYDYNIGQRLADVLPYADWVSPMVYPSHYPDGFKGLGNPSLYPYEIVKWSLDSGTDLMLGVYAGSEEELRARWRPWIQDFDIGAVYTAELIEAQIQASRDAGASGWILWNARNVYEPANYR
jgi:hypothetical protein